MTKEMLLITNCNDSMLWYSDFVGYCVPLVSTDKHSFWSKEPEGYLNIVEKEHAKLVQVIDDREGV